jgi:hypothetical protein
MKGISRTIPVCGDDTLGADATFKVAAMPHVFHKRYNGDDALCEEAGFKNIPIFGDVFPSRQK